jgi:hypothetical protein
MLSTSSFWLSIGYVHLGVNAVVVPTAQFALKMHRPASLSYDA